MSFLLGYYLPAGR